MKLHGVMLRQDWHLWYAMWMHGMRSRIGGKGWTRTGMQRTGGLGGIWDDEALPQAELLGGLKLGAFQLRIASNPSPALQLDLHHGEQDIRQLLISSVLAPVCGFCGGP